MSRKTIRPKIEILRECSGDASAQDLFISLLVDRMRNALTSNGTFEAVKEPEYGHEEADQMSLREEET